MKRISFYLSVLTLLACMPAAGFAFGINIDIPIPVPPPIIIAPPAPAVVVEPVQPAEPMPPQEQYLQEQYPQQQYQQEQYPQEQYPQEYPAEEYIPEGDPTPPPPLAVQNPDLVVVPSGEAQVYMVPNTAGVYFYGGTWYRQHHGVWFTAGEYNAPWAVVQTTAVPGFVADISPAYALSLPPTYHRIHYNDFHRNWRTWDHDRRWERERWYKNERRSEVRQARERQAHDRMMRDRQARQQHIKDRERHGSRPGQPGPHKPGQFDQRRPGQQGHIDQRKPGQRGPIEQNKVGPHKPPMKQQPKHIEKPKPKHPEKEKPREKDKH